MNKFLKLLGSNIFAQGIVIVTTPLLTRIYSPADFGVYGVLVSIIGILGAVASLQFDVAILNAKTDKDSILLYHICMISMMVFCTLIFFGFYLLYPNINALNQLETGSLTGATVAGMGIFVNRFMIATNNFSVRYDRINEVAVSKIYSSVSSQFLKLILGFSGFVSGTTLLVSKIVGELISVFWLFSKIKTSVVSHESIFSEYKAVVKTYKRFPIYNTWSALLYNGNIQIPALVLILFFDKETTGFFVFARSIVNIPVNILIQSFIQLFNVNIIKIKEKKTDVSREINHNISLLLKIALIPFIFLIAYGNEIFEVIFGPRWSTAGLMLEIMAIMIFFNFITSALQPVFNIFEKQHLNIVYSIASIATTLGTLILGGFTKNIVTTVWLLSIGNSIIRCIMFTKIMSICDCKYSDLINSVRNLFFTGGFISAWIIINNLFVKDKAIFTAMTILVTLFSLIYYVFSMKQSMDLY